MASTGGIVSFLRGIVNGTKTPTTLNMTVCEQKVVQKWDLNAKKLMNYTKSGDFFKVGWTTLDMIYNLNNIT